MNYKLIPLEQFEYDRSVPKGGLGVFKRVLASHVVTTYGSVHNPPYTGIRRISTKEYIKVVPCNPILNFLGLLQYDKNKEYFARTEEARFADKEAEEYYKKFGSQIDSATIMSMAWKRSKEDTPCSTK